MLRCLRAVATAGLLVAVASCGETASNAAPFHAVPDDAVVVWGTASCRASFGADLVLECELDMSDPRVSGAETIEKYRGYAEGSGGREWTFDRDVITNAEGTWRGSAQGSDDPPGAPVGESHLVGEGAYEGLEFHYYFAQPPWPEGDAHLRGWISESMAADPASTTAPVAPFHTIPAGSVAVSGTATCDDEGGARVCRLDLSDPRVSGTETQNRVRILAGSISAGDVSMADDARITTPDGAWRGRVQAARDDASVPAPVGEAHYIGEGTYEGLEFRYYFADLDIAADGEVLVHGWISPAA